MDIVQEIKALEFPLGKYVVVGSGVLEVNSIRKARDIDIVVTPDLYEKCESGGWEKQWHDTGQRYVLHKRDRGREVEVYLDVNCDDVQLITEELIERADVIEGVPFVSLKDLLKLKRAYSKYRDKHLSDIEGIEEKLGYSKKP